MLKTALIVDDSKLARLTLRRMLSQYDIDVEEAEGVLDGESVIANTILPDVIFMDVMMPEIDGFEGLARLRNNPETAELPVIMYSGDISEEARTKARDNGATGYLPKPADIKRLDHLVDALNKRLQSSKTKAVKTPEPEAVKQKPTPNMQPSAHANFAAFSSQLPTMQTSAPISSTVGSLNASISDELMHRINTLENSVSALGKNATISAGVERRLTVLESARPEIPDDLQKRLSTVEKRVSYHEKRAVSENELNTDIERHRRDIIYLQRQVSKSDQVAKIAIGIASASLLIALAALIRQFL